MAKTRIQKEEAVEGLTDKLNRAKAVVFADYQQAGTSGSKGMTMHQLMELRDKLRQVSAEFIITKNSLLKRALPTTYPLREASQLPTTTFEGPTATLFAYEDEVTPIKVLVKTLKDNSVGSVKAGFLGTQLLDAAKISQLSTLPSKDELLGLTVGVIAAPLKGMLTVLQGNLRNLVYALDQIRILKGGES